MRDLSEELFGKHFNGLHYEDITKDIIISFAEDLVRINIGKCVHPYRCLERNANGLFCTKCKTQVSNDPNIY